MLAFLPFSRSLSEQIDCCCNYAIKYLDMSLLHNTRLNTQKHSEKPKQMLPFWNKNKRMLEKQCLWIKKLYLIIPSPSQIIVYTQPFPHLTLPSTNNNGNPTHINTHEKTHNNSNTGSQIKTSAGGYKADLFFYLHKPSFVFMKRLQRQRMSSLLTIKFSKSQM